MRRHPVLVLDWSAYAEYVYFITCALTERTKIGYSKTPHARLTAIQANSPSKLNLTLVIPGAKDIEGYLHSVFALHRKHGEWFELGVDEVEIVKEIYRWVRFVWSAEELERFADDDLTDFVTAQRFVGDDGMYAAETAKMVTRGLTCYRVGDLKAIRARGKLWDFPS